ncbi:structural maintenance of chromosomes protein 4 isoform X1 [Neltuma alba]|uniref:structural maintenance of chromosomes protein 4 isoform X1 n=1 Tax=Neltuma alba TaxID=207710 RepID=UPI0010A442FE|nr:structural maintenance of chromosomes protein 4-like isoform X1 [Prosopis alba]XP_028798602.1 structural maintenance of chromosomes protein 4-like isoform X1 [Prosopis alba]XP_028798603.1 structural maintenance of chromosomes protein 4-like isoform X1 [Prosopis alba]
MMKGTRKTSIHAEEKKKKRKRGKIADDGEALGMKIEEDSSMLVERKKKKSSSLKRKNKVKNLVDKQRPNVQVDLKEHRDGVGDNSSEAQWTEDFKEPEEIDAGLTTQARSKSKKTKKKRKKEAHSVKEVLNSRENGGVTEQDEIYTISSGDEDCSKGMKKWIMEYHQSRPGLQALQDQIDDFITAHEEKLEEERKEREARAAEGGWTVVVHHKGRKKTTDSESGIVVSSVAQAAAEQKAAKKKHKEVALNFYRFQKKEAQRNEIMMLQSKFEEDKKRLQQLRASRKFRPY